MVHQYCCFIGFERRTSINNTSESVNVKTFRSAIYNPCKFQKVKLYLMTEGFALH